MTRGKWSNKQSPLRDSRLIYSDKLGELCSAMSPWDSTRWSPEKKFRGSSQEFSCSPSLPLKSPSPVGGLFWLRHQRSEVGRRILVTEQLQQLFWRDRIRASCSFITRWDRIFSCSFSKGKVVVTNSLLQYESWSPVTFLVLLYTGAIKAPARANRTSVKFTAAKRLRFKVLVNPLY